MVYRHVHRVNRKLTVPGAAKGLPASLITSRHMAGQRVGGREPGLGPVAPADIVTVPGAADWQDVDSDVTFGTGTCDTTGEGVGRTVATFTGDFEFSFTMTGGEAVTSCGIYEIDEDATYMNAGGYGNLAAMTDSWGYNQGDDTIKYGSANQKTSVTWTAGQVFKISRVGTTIEIFKDGASEHLFSQTTGNEVRIMMGGGSGVNADNLQWSVPG